jgi:threonine synthase
VIAHYRDWLPLSDSDPVITLGEGSTPLVAAEKLSEILRCEAWIKVEGANPTGSFKDRGMTVALSVAAGQGAQAVVCASTGNTSAAAAAYAARAGLSTIVLLPAGRIAMGKLAQAIVHGAKVVQVDGNFDDCLELARNFLTNTP